MKSAPLPKTKSARLRYGVDASKECERKRRHDVDRHETRAQRMSEGRDKVSWINERVAYGCENMILGQKVWGCRSAAIESRFGRLTAQSWIDGIRGRRKGA